NVSLIANEIIIENDAKIESGVKIQGKSIRIGKKSVIEKDSDIFVLEKFCLGNRAILCICDIKSRNVIIGDDFFSNVPKNEMMIVAPIKKSSIMAALTRSLINIERS
ncbi:MAG: hypothetical protein IH784_02335, partial [Bacteroidetes bacterium]|nr:hypothetical protein [Bacteroidota bacterium]